VRAAHTHIISIPLLSIQVATGLQYNVCTHPHTCARVSACLPACLPACLHSAPAATKPLDRVKWGAYVGAFFNREFTANALYTDVRRAYTSLRRSALAQRGDPPLVCWAYKDWNSESGTMPLSRHFSCSAGLWQSHLLRLCLVLVVQYQLCLHLMLVCDL
jgi:hypothetical protein